MKKDRDDDDDGGRELEEDVWTLDRDLDRFGVVRCEQGLGTRPSIWGFLIIIIIIFLKIKQK